jgi:hypothetical protein
LVTISAQRFAAYDSTLANAFACSYYCTKLHDNA